jgi:hypothetical protein
VSERNVPKRALSGVTADVASKGAANAAHTLDVLVQAATVDLFRSYGLAIAPMPKKVTGAGVGRSGDLVGSIRFSGSGASGTLWLVLSPEVVQQTRSSEMRVFQSVDWTRELANQLMGRLKNRLLRYQVHVQAELASASVRAGSLVFDQGDLYPFRTLRGEITVILAATLDGARFVYSSVEVGNEGDVVLF